MGETPKRAGGISMKYMTIGLRREVSLVLLPIDDFTDRIITGSQLHVYTREDHISSFRKPDGYHVFCDLVGNEVEVCLEGPLYQKKILKLPIGLEEPNVYQVRMLPGISYPLPQGTTVIRGAFPEGNVIRVFFPRLKRSCKLLYDYDPSIHREELSLFQPYEMSLKGKTLCICGKEKDLEFFRVSDQKGNICSLEHPLSKVYQKMSTSVYPVYEAAAGEDGNIYLPISRLTEDEACVCVLMGAGQEEKTCEIVITAGKVNWITEDVWREEG